MIHTLFDILASLLSLTATLLVWRWRLAGEGTHVLETRDSVGYALALIAGAAIGGYGFGTLNLWLSDVPGIGRSIVGALAGAIVAIEIYKRAKGIAGSTGIIFVAGFATTVAVGRWGCFFAGLDDNTYGTPTSLPWGHDFGDGILRHPVQLYESASMTLFLAFALVCLARRQPFFMANGFYLMVGFYAAQRFVWEFFKPYASVFGPFNVFHILCAALVAYALLMMLRERTHVTAAG